MGQAGLVVSEAASLDDLRDEWERLATAGGDLFRSWEWARAWEHEHGTAGRVLLTFSRGAELVGIARLSRVRRGPVRWYTFEGQGAADQIGPVCAPADRAEVAGALRRAVSTHRGRPGLLLASGFVGEERWSGMLDGVALQSRPSPVLDLGGLSWTSWLASKSANFRQQTQRRERKLVRDHGLAFRRIDGRDELDAAWTGLLRLHDERWQGGSDFFASGGDRLHRTFAGMALERGWLRLWAADLEGEPAAYWLGYRYGDAYWFFQLARDVRWAQTSVGMVLLGHTVRSALEEGVARYRFLSGSHEYKLRFADADAGHEEVLVGGPALTLAARTALRAGRRVPPPLRARARALAHGRA